MYYKILIFAGPQYKGPTTWWFYVCAGPLLSDPRL